MKDMELDVRALLRKGREPFGVIMQAVQQLERGQRLRLYATFKPEPLLSLMAARGFSSSAHPIEGGDWLVVFTPAAAASSESGDGEAGAPETWPDPSYFLDCTDPDAPEAPQRIARRPAVMEPGEVLFALLACEPVEIYPVLEESQAAWVGDFDPEGGGYRLLVRKRLGSD